MELDHNEIINYLPKITLLAAFILDIILGDPYCLPHPVRLFGKIISLGEKHLNSGMFRKLKGVVFVLICTSLVFIALVTLEIYLKDYVIIHSIYLIVMIFYGLANKSLIKEALKVEKSLQKDGIEAARKQLSYIVGRDTNSLSEKQIRIAVLETLSENLSDGVIAPLFFFGIGGIPLMFTYKMINTLDSMIGYKNERYIDFGWFAARTDDIFNYIPARITAFLMVLISFNLRGGKFIFKFGKKHSSPNAGFPEAALAGILNCRFGGPNYYHGILVNKPYIGLKDRKICPNDIIKAIKLNMITTTIFVLLIFFLQNHLFFFIKCFF